MTPTAGSTPTADMTSPKEKAIIGSLLGTAVADALGLPMEGLSKARQRKMFPEVEGYGLLFGKGMVSDDTEQTCLVAQSIIASGANARVFAEQLSWRMRRWLLGLPAGVGLATLRAILKLLVGFPVEKSGVFSAGNGPAMRSSIIGVCFGERRARLRELVTLSTRITHTDPKAVYGALAVALAAFCASRHDGDPRNYLRALRDVLGPEGEEFLGLAREALDSAGGGRTTEDFAADLGLDGGVTGYVYHTVPVALHAWFRHPADFQSALTEAIQCGGDTDTLAAIVGGIVGASVGKEGIPSRLITDLRDWPITIQWLESLGKTLCDVVSGGACHAPPRIPYFGSLFRNFFFMAVVLTHGFRRLLPPF